MPSGFYLEPARVEDPAGSHFVYREILCVRLPLCIFFLPSRMAVFRKILGRQISFERHRLLSWKRIINAPQLNQFETQRVRKTKIRNFQGFSHSSIHSRWNFHSIWTFTKITYRSPSSKKFQLRSWTFYPSILYRCSRYFNNCSNIQNALHA